MCQCSGVQYVFQGPSNNANLVKNDIESCKVSWHARILVRDSRATALGVQVFPEASPGLAFYSECPQAAVFCHIAHHPLLVLLHTVYH